MTLASLPAQMLYVAAQFASVDPIKQALTGILVRPAKDGGIQIDSSDGYRAFNVTCPDPVWSCHKPLLLNPKSFVKRILNPENYPKIYYSDGREASHKMAWEKAGDKYIVYPTILWNGDTLTEFSPDVAFQHAWTTGNYIPFDTPEDADWI